MAKRKKTSPAAKSADVPGSPGLAFRGLDELIGYRLRRAQSAVHRDYNIMFDELKLTQKQTGVLWLVNVNPGIAQGTIGAALGMDRATMMVLVDRLEGRGLIRRMRSARDARQRELFATPAGERMMKKVQDLTVRHERRLKTLFTSSELRLFEDLLQRLQGLASTGED